MSKQYTSGPWACKKDDRGEFLIYEKCYNGFLIADLRHSEVEQNEANAHLIAASPDLLEACKAALEVRIKFGNSDTPTSQLLRNAINKAEGK